MHYPLWFTDTLPIPLYNPVMKHLQIIQFERILYFLKKSYPIHLSDTKSLVRSVAGIQAQRVTTPEPEL